MAEETKTFLEYLLKQDQLPSGFSIDLLCTQKEMLQPKMDSIKSQSDILQYEPVFTHGQRPVGKKKG
jgi:hypothetical protein